MSRRAPSKIHVVTRAYLAAWAPPPRRLLRPVDVVHGPGKLKNPAAVGWSHQWWGAGNPALNQVCETACSKLEGLAPRLLAELDDRWPLPPDERAVLGQFIALHVVRTEAGRRAFETAREWSLERLEVDWDEEMPFEEFAAFMRSDQERARKLLAMINKLTTQIGSMHWTLLRFAEPLLVTCDQPVSPVPLVESGARQRVVAIPPDGWIETVEIRFPVQPRLSLIASWHPGQEADRSITGSWDQAVNLNLALVAQAERHWFHVPDRYPALPSAIERRIELDLQPVSPDLIPGYGPKAARDSPLRESITAEIADLIERQDDTVIKIGRPTFEADRRS